MKYYSLAIDHRDAGWFLHPLTGSLHQVHLKDLSKFQNSNLPNKIREALDLCASPYDLKPPNFNQESLIDKSKLKSIEKFYFRLILIRKINFWVVHQYANIFTPLFDNSLQAFEHLSELNLSALTDPKGCLNRTFAVAKSSIEFRKSGVLFIGADLPLTHLHAWIIENNYQPDPWDRDWINYLPIAAYAY